VRRPPSTGTSPWTLTCGSPALGKLADPADAVVERSRMIVPFRAAQAVAEHRSRAGDGCPGRTCSWTWSAVRSRAARPSRPSRGSAGHRQQAAAGVHRVRTTVPARSTVPARARLARAVAEAERARGFRPICHPRSCRGCRGPGRSPGRSTPSGSGASSVPGARAAATFEVRWS